MAKWAIHDDNGNVTDTFTVDPKKYYILIWQNTTSQ